MHRLHLWLPWNLHVPYYTFHWNTDHQHTFTQNFLVWLSPPGNCSKNPGKTLPLTMPLQLLVQHYPTSNSPWNSPYLLLQENITIHANGPATFHTPSVNETYLYWHPSSFIKCTNKTSIMLLHQNYPYWPTSLSPSPPLPPLTTSTSVTNQKTYGCANILTIH